MKSRIFLSPPHLTGEEQKYIKKAFEDNWIAPLGGNVNELERRLESYLGDNKFVSTVNSGTSALHLALIMLGVGRDDEVICQSLTFVATANPIVYLGAQPVFVGSEMETGNICPIALEEAIKDRINKGKKPKAIIAVHLYGMPYNVMKIHSLAEKYDIPIVEDAAEALGSKYYGKHCGTFGVISLFSFNGNKIITGSSGGVVVANSLEQKKRIDFLSSQAKDDAPYFLHSELGYNYRMSNITAGIICGQMEVIEDRVQSRRKNFEYYRNAFMDIDGITVLEEPNENYYSNHWLTTAIIDEKLFGLSKENLMKKFDEENIECRHIWKPLHTQPFYKHCSYYGDEYAEKLFKDGICFPSGSNLSKEDLGRISNVVCNR